MAIRLYLLQNNRYFKKSNKQLNNSQLALNESIMQIQIRQCPIENSGLILDVRNSFNVLAAQIRNALDLKQQQNKDEQDQALLLELSRQILEFDRFYHELHGVFWNRIIVSSINIELNLFEEYHQKNKLFYFGKNGQLDYITDIDYFQQKNQPWSIFQKLEWIFFQCQKSIQLFQQQYLDEQIEKFYWQKFLQYYGLSENIQDLNKRIRQFQFITSQKPIDINQVVYVVKQKINFETIRDTSQVSVYNFYQLLKNIKDSFPESKAQIFIKYLKKQEETKRHICLQTLTYFYYQTIQTIENKPKDELQRMCFYQVRCDHPIEPYISKQLIKFTRQIITSNPFKSQTAKIYLNPHKFIEIFLNIKQTLSFQLFRTLTCQQSKNKNQYSSEIAFYGMYLDVLFGNIIKLQKYTLRLQKVDLPGYQQPIKLQFRVKTNQNFIEFNRFSNQSQEIQSISRIHLKDLIKKTIKYQICTSGIPVSSASKNYSSKSKVIDGVICRAKSNQQGILLQIYTIDVTFAKKLNSYRNKVKNATKLFTQLQQSQMNYLLHNQNEKIRIFFHHIIIGHEDVFSKQSKNKPYGKIWEIGYAPLKQLNFSGISSQTQLKLVHLKYVATKI